MALRYLCVHASSQISLPKLFSNLFLTAQLYSYMHKFILKLSGLMGLLRVLGLQKDKHV